MRKASSLVGKVLRGIAVAIDWCLMGLFAMRRPATLDDQNARCGLDRMNSYGEIIGKQGYKPGERPPPPRQ